MPSKPRGNTSSRTDYTAIVPRKPVPLVHQDVVPSGDFQTVKNVPYVPPPGLTATEQKVLTSCDFLTTEKRNYLAAHMRGQVTGFLDFSTEEVARAKLEAIKQGIKL